MVQQEHIYGKIESKTDIERLANMPAPTKAIAQPNRSSRAAPRKCMSHTI